MKYWIEATTQGFLNGERDTNGIRRRYVDYIKYLHHTDAAVIRSWILKHQDKIGYCRYESEKYKNKKFIGVQVLDKNVKKQKQPKKKKMAKYSTKANKITISFSGDPELASQFFDRFKLNI